MKNIFKILSLLVFTSSLVGCLKDDKYALDPSGSNNVVEFYNATAPVSGYNDRYVMYRSSFEALDEAEFTAGVNWAGPEDFAPVDIVVQLASSTEAITNFNATRPSNQAPIAELDASLYEFPPSVTIKKGEKTALFTVKVKPSQFDFNARNGFALSITSASHGIISGNVGTVIFDLPVKNIYDGIYEILEGSHIQRYSTPGNPTVNDALNGSLFGNPNIQLTTVDQSTVELVNMRWAGGSSGVAGIDNTRATINSATNQVSMFSLGNSTLRNWPGKVNSYDPATKTFTLNFDWNPTGASREMTLILKYVGPR